MSSRPIRLRVEDIWEAIEKIERYIHGFDRKLFLGDDKTVDSVIRNLEIIGEAANRLPKVFTAQDQKIAWHRIIGFRNRIVHDYFGIDFEIIWEILHDEIPRFREEISTIRKALLDERT